MNERIKKKWNVIFILLAIVCFLIMSFFYLLFDDKQTFEFSNKVINIDKGTYKITGEVPVYRNNKMNKEVDKLVDAKKRSLMEKDASKLKLNYSFTIHGKIYTFHYRSLFYKDNKLVNRDDNYKYYDSEKNVELSIDDLIKRNTEYYNKLKYVVDNYLNNHKSINAKDYDYVDNIIFSEDKIYIIIPNEDKDYNIPVEYLDVKKFLNTDYFTVEGTYEELKVKEEKPEVKPEDIKEEKKTEPKKEEKKTTTKKTTPIKKEDEKLKSTNDGSQDKIVPVVRDAKYFEGKKLICFTFDDGPAGKTTTRLLDGLKARNFKATFFMVGNRVAKNKSLVLRMKNEGHSIGQHSYSHKNLKKLSENAAKNEIYLANDAIRAIIGDNPLYIRPPYGSYSKEVLNYADMVFVNWSIDPLDWKYKNADTVYKNIINKAYDGAIVLVHDLYSTSVDGALRAMDYLAKNGYAIVSIDEMKELRGLNLQTHHLYNSFKKK